MLSTDDSCVLDIESDIEFHQKIYNSNDRLGTVEFEDFLEPNLIKTGHLIPLRSGHNGPFNQIEKTLYEIHLTNSGMAFDFMQAAQVSGDPLSAALDVTRDGSDYSD